MPTVTITILSDDPSPVPISEVIVEFYTTTAIFQTSGTTGSNGKITVSLPDNDYDVLFYKIGVSIKPKQPQRITVSTSLVNSFVISAHVRTRPESTDPRRCTISGHIIGVDGKQSTHRLIFEPVKALTIISSNIIAPYSRKEIASTIDGYFEFELLKNTKYSAYFVFPQDLFGTQPGKLDIVVPNSPSIDLHDLLFPIPINLDFSNNVISLVSGNPTDESIEVVLNFSDGSTREYLGTPWSDVAVTNTDPTIVEATILSAKKLQLKPISPGTVTISTLRIMADLALFDPLPDYITESVVVTVT